MAHPPRSKPPLRSSSGPPNPCITPSTETLVVVVNLMSWSPPHVHAWCAHEARITSRRESPDPRKAKKLQKSCPLTDHASHPDPCRAPAARCSRWLSKPAVL